MTVSPWFDPNWRALYAEHFKRYLALYALAKKAGRKLQPRITNAADEAENPMIATHTEGASRVEKR